MVLSIISSWSVSNSELDWAEVRLFASGVLQQMGGGTLLFVVVRLLVILHSVRVWGLLNWGEFDSSLTLLPLSSLMYSKEGSISFASSYFNSLGNWLGSFAIVSLLNATGYITIY